jgi:N-acyl-D-amino-acid deacylase
MNDILIRNGNIIDGSGKEMFKGDIAIKGDTIVAVGRLEDLSAGEVIDADNRIVSTFTLMPIWQFHSRITPRYSNRWSCRE